MEHPEALLARPMMQAGIELNVVRPAWDVVAGQDYLVALLAAVRFVGDAQDARVGRGAHEQIDERAVRADRGEPAADGDRDHLLVLPVELADRLPQFAAAREERFRGLRCARHRRQAD